MVPDGGLDVENAIRRRFLQQVVGLPASGLKQLSLATDKDSINRSRIEAVEMRWM